MHGRTSLPGVMVCISFPFHFQLLNFACVCVLEDKLLDEIFSFHHICPGVGTQNFQHGRKRLYPLIYLVDPIHQFKNVRLPCQLLSFKELLWARLNQLLGMVGYCKGTWAKGQLLIFLVVLRCQGEGEHHGGMTSPLSELRILPLNRWVVITGQVCKCLLHTCTYFECFWILAGEKMIRDTTQYIKMPLPRKVGDWVMDADIHLEECSLASNEASLGRCWLEIWKQNASVKCSPKA